MSRCVSLLLPEAKTPAGFSSGSVSIRIIDFTRLMCFCSLSFPSMDCFLFLFPASRGIISHVCQCCLVCPFSTLCARLVVKSIVGYTENQITA